MPNQAIFTEETVAIDFILDPKRFRCRENFRIENANFWTDFKLGLLNGGYKTLYQQKYELLTVPTARRLVRRTLARDVVISEVVSFFVDNDMAYEIKTMCRDVHHFLKLQPCGEEGFLSVEFFSGGDFLSGPDKSPKNVFFIPHCKDGLGVFIPQFVVSSWHINCLDAEKALNQEIPTGSHIFSLAKGW